MNISANNEQASKAVDEKDENKYEYKRIELEEHQAAHIYIPWEVIADVSLDARRVGIFSYLRTHCGINNVVNLTVPDMVEWCGGKPDRRANGTNDKFLYALDAFSDDGYLTYLTERSRSAWMKCKLDTNRYFSKKDKQKNRYAVVYLDEIEAIMSYQRENEKDSTVSNFVILLVFAYLRHKIKRRSNLLKPEERSAEKIKERRKKMPDAYSGNISDMADEIGISSKTFSKIVNILECDLHLIVTDTAYRVRNEDGEFRTPPAIFANAYKRDEKYLLDVGKGYSRKEMELKAEQLKGYFANYEINKTKRK